MLWTWVPVEEDILEFFIGFSENKLTCPLQVVDFLRDHLITNEPILSSLRISNTWVSALSGLVFSGPYRNLPGAGSHGIMRSFMLSLTLDLFLRKELTILLKDVVHDCMTCPASNLLRDVATQALLGVCLASRASLFEKQVILHRSTFLFSLLSNLSLHRKRFAFQLITKRFHCSQTNCWFYVQDTPCDGWIFC